MSRGPGDYQRRILRMFNRGSHLTAADLTLLLHGEHPTKIDKAQMRRALRSLVAQGRLTRDNWIPGMWHTMVYAPNEQDSYWSFITPPPVRAQQLADANALRIQRGRQTVERLAQTPPAD